MKQTLNTMCPAGVQVRIVMTAFLLGLPFFARAQSRPAVPPDGKLATALESLSRQAGALTSAIPSFECTETGISLERNGDQEKHRSTFTATIRAQRDAHGELQESFRTTELNGKPYNKPRVDLPLYVRGGFSDALAAFATERQACYDYALVAPDKITFQQRPGERPGCLKFVGRQGVATLDADGWATRVEVHVPVEQARREHYLSSYSVDLRPVELSGQTFRLVSALSAEMPQSSGLLHFEASYQSCRRYGSTSTILPGAAVVDGESSPR